MISELPAQVATILCPQLEKLKFSIAPRIRATSMSLFGPIADFRILL